MRTDAALPRRWVGADGTTGAEPGARVVIPTLVRRRRKTRHTARHGHRRAHLRRARRPVGVGGSDLQDACSRCRRVPRWPRPREWSHGEAGDNGPRWRPRRSSCGAPHVQAGGDPPHRQTRRTAGRPNVLRRSQPTTRGARGAPCAARSRQRTPDQARPQTAQPVARSLTGLLHQRPNPKCGLGRPGMSRDITFVELGGIEPSHTRRFVPAQNT
jgi:hypothetical protein